MPTGLHAWIQAQHLTEPALLQFRKSFQRHPARLLILRDFLQESAADRLARFLHKEAEFQPKYGLYSAEEVAATKENWLRAEEEDRFFRSSMLTRVPEKYKLSPNTITYLRFRRDFQDPNLREFFERLSGLSLSTSNSFACHAMNSGDFLKVHDDNYANRRLALVIYLTPGWESRFGGALTMVSAEGHQTRIEAEYNSLVVFDVTAGSKHFIEPITAHAGNRARMTISGWYLNGETQCLERLYATAD